MNGPLDSSDVQRLPLPARPHRPLRLALLSKLMVAMSSFWTLTPRRMKPCRSRSVEWTAQAKGLILTECDVDFGELGGHAGSALRTHQRQGAPLRSRDERVSELTGAVSAPARPSRVKDRATPRFRRTATSIRARDIPKLCRMLCSRALIVVEQASKPRTTNHQPYSVLGGSVRHDQHIAETLVIALLMKMRTVFSNRTAQHSLPNRDQPR